MATKKEKLKKTVDVQVPKNLDEVSRFLSRIAQEQRAIDAIKADLNEKVEALQAVATEETNPHVECLGGLFEGLYIFAQANRETLTDGGKRKTIDVPTGTFSWRLAKPAVHLKDVKEVVKALQTMKLTQFIRVIEEPNKEAMLKEPELAQSVKGVTIKQLEYFTAKPNETAVEIAIDVNKLQKKVS